MSIGEIVPRIYGAPNIHKNDVNMIGSPTYLLAKFIAKALNHLVRHTDSYIKDSN